MAEPLKRKIMFGIEISSYDDMTIKMGQFGIFDDKQNVITFHYDQADMIVKWINDAKEQIESMGK